jgi:hypothetical protein
MSQEPGKTGKGECKMTYKSHVFCLIAGSLLALLPLSTTAQETSAALGNLHTLRVLLDKAAMDYQMFKGENGNPRYDESLRDSLSRIADVRERLQSSLPTDTQQQNIAQMQRHVEQFLKQLRGNRDRIAGGGYEEFSLVDQMYNEKQKAQQLAVTIADTLSQDMEEEVPQNVQRVRELSFAMQRMAAAYIEQTASAFGTAYRGQGDEKPVDQLAREFSGKLEELSLESKDSPTTQVMMNQVRRRWSFIEQSMLNYKENTVPFLVYRYANAIVDDLLTIADIQTGQGPGAMPAGGGGAVPLPPGMRQGDAEATR